MKVLVTGASGLVGSQLVRFLEEQGSHVLRLLRSAPHLSNASPCLHWNPQAEEIDVTDEWEGLDAVVHLAGENIAAKRWSRAQKKRIRESRICGTRLLANALVKLTRPPRVFASASAIGYYGDRGEEWMHESSSPGQGFLPEVCTKWEKAAFLPKESNIRTVNLRIGVVLSTNGGALAKMLPAFKAGAGGRIGHGKQYMSWIEIHDAVRAISHILDTDTLEGPVNLVAPEPVTNRVFTSVLGRTLHRPTLLPVPSFAAKLLLGEMADELLLSSTRVKPTKLQDSLFEFQHSEIIDALNHLICN